MVPPLNLSPSSTRLPDLDFSHLRDVVRASPDDDLAQARRFKHRVQHKLDGRQRRSGRTANWLSHTGQRALGRSFLKAWGFDDYGGDRETFEPDDVRVLPGRVVVSMPDGTLPLLHVPISIIDTLAPRKHDPLETRAQAARAFEEFCRRTVEGLLNRHSPMGQEDELGCWLIKKDKAPPPSRQRGRSRRPAGRGNGSAGTKSGKSRSSASATAKGTTLGSGSTTLYPPTSKSGRSTRLASVSQSGPDAPSTPRGASQSRGSSRRSSTLRSAASQADPVPPPRRVVVSDEAAAAISRYFASTAVCASPAGYTSGSGADKTDSDLPAGGSVPTVGQYSLESIYEDDDDVQVSVLQTFTVAPLEEEAVDEEEEEEGEDLLADGQMDPELAETLKELPPAPFAQRKARCEDEFAPRSSSSADANGTSPRHLDDPFLLASRSASADVAFSPSGLPMTNPIRSPLLNIMGWTNARTAADWERWNEEVVQARAPDESAVRWGHKSLRLDDDADME